MPRTDAVLADPRLVSAVAVLGRATVKGVVAGAQERAGRGEIAPEAVADAAVAPQPRRATTLTHVINATGVVLHTNLGRAPLSAAAAEALAKRLGEAGIAAEAVPSAAVIGGGGAPEVELRSWAVALAAGLAEPLRAKAVVGRVERGRLLLDLRCVPPDRDGEIYAAVREA